MQLEVDLDLIVDEVLYVEVVEVNGVFHDVLQDQRWYERPDWTSEDGGAIGLSHVGEVEKLKAGNFQKTGQEDRGIRKKSP